MGAEAWLNGVGRAENVRPVSFQGFLMITITLYRLLLNSTANTDSNFMREDKAVGKPAEFRQQGIQELASAFHPVSSEGTKTIPRLLQAWGKGSQPRCRTNWSISRVTPCPQHASEHIVKVCSDGGQVLRWDKLQIKTNLHCSLHNCCSIARLTCE